MFNTNPDPDPGGSLAWSDIMLYIGAIHDDIEERDAALCGLPVDCVRVGCVARSARCETCERGEVKA